MENEKIVHAAVKSKTGWIFIGKCHADCFHKMKYINVEPSTKALDQGFVTSKGRFVDRKTAALIAEKANQIEKLKIDILFSEDMWHPSHGAIHIYSEVKGYEPNGH